MAVYIIQCTDGADLREGTPDANEDGGASDFGSTNAHRCGMADKTKEIDPLLHFDFTSVGSGESITSAYLLLYVIAIVHGGDAAHPDQYTWAIARCRRSAYNSDDWVTDEATFNAYKTGSNWGTAGAKNSSTDFYATNRISPNGPSDTDINTYWEVDVLAMVEDAHGEDRILNIVFDGAKTLTGEFDTCYWDFSSYVCDIKPKLLIATDGSTPLSHSEDIISHWADDAYETEDTTVVTLTGATVPIYADTDAEDRRWGGFFFDNATWPAQSKAILEAYLLIRIGSASLDNVRCDIYAEDAAGPSTFTTDNADISGRTPTTEGVEWIESAMGLGYWQATPSLVDVIQELADDYTITSVALVLKPRTDANVRLLAYSEQNGALYAARLILTWGEPAAPSADILKISGVDWANVKQVSGVAEASISKVSGVTAN